MATTTCTSTASSGTSGAVWCGAQRIARVTSWNLDATTDSKTFHDSGGGGTNSVKGYMNRIPGPRDLTGSIEFKYDLTFPQDRRFREGRCCQLVLGIHETNSVAWIIPQALIERLTISVDIDGGDPTEGSFDFGSDGIYYAPGEAGAPNPFPLPTVPT